MAWQHDELVSDLAAHVAAGGNRMVWTDLAMGPAGSPRPDVWSLDKSYVRTRAITYEVKVSTSDFRRDVTEGKWQRYLSFSSGVYFAVPQGLVKKADVPPSAGLMVRGEKGWRAVKKPVLDTCEIDWVVARKLLIDGDRKRADKTLPPHRRWNEYLTTREHSKKWGERVARIIADSDAIEREVACRKEAMKRDGERARKNASTVRDDASRTMKRVYERVAAILGCPVPTSDWECTRAVTAAMSRLDIDAHEDAAAELDAAASRTRDSAQQLESRAEDFRRRAAQAKKSGAEGCAGHGQG